MNLQLPKLNLPAKLLGISAAAASLTGNPAEAAIADKALSTLETNSNKQARVIQPKQSSPTTHEQGARSNTDLMKLFNAQPMAFSFEPKAAASEQAEGINLNTGGELIARGKRLATVETPVTSQSMVDSILARVSRENGVYTSGEVKGSKVKVYEDPAVGFNKFNRLVNQATENTIRSMGVDMINVPDGLVAKVRPDSIVSLANKLERTLIDTDTREAKILVNLLGLRFDKLADGMSRVEVQELKESGRYTQEEADMLLSDKVAAQESLLKLGFDHKIVNATKNLDNKANKKIVDQKIIELINNIINQKAFIQAGSQNAFDNIYDRLNNR
jgi:hypothetical protein